MKKLVILIAVLALCMIDVVVCLGLALDYETVGSGLHPVACAILAGVAVVGACAVGVLYWRTLE